MQEEPEARARKVAGVVAVAFVVLSLVLRLTGSSGPGMHGGH